MAIQWAYMQLPVRVLVYLRFSILYEINFKNLVKITKYFMKLTAQCFQHIVVLPMDQVRTQQQTIRTEYRPKTNNPINHLIKIYKVGGLRGMYLGSGAVLVGCGPAHALQVGLLSFCVTL